MMVDSLFQTTCHCLGNGNYELQISPMIQASSLKRLRITFHSRRNELVRCGAFPPPPFGPLCVGMTESLPFRIGRMCASCLSQQRSKYTMHPETLWPYCQRTPQAMWIHS